MSPLTSFKEIPINDIQTKTIWNLRPFSLAKPSIELCSSLAVLNLIHPPIVIAAENKTYSILSGRRRIIAFRKVFPDKKTIPILLLQENIGYERILQYLLTDKIYSGHFSPMEKAYFFQLCLEHMSIKSAAQKFLPLMKEKSQPHIITKYISLCNLEPELQQSVHTEQINPKLGMELLSLSKEDRSTLHTLFRRLEFGGGKQKRLLALSKDLAGRQQTQISTLLTEKEYEAILNHPEMNLPQKGASLLTLLHSQLYPQSNGAEEDFNKRVQRMKLESSCSIEHSPAFERDEIQLHLKFATLDDLEKQLATIKKLQLTAD